MNLPNVFIHGLKTGLRQWRIASVVYLIQLGLALTLGLQVHEVLEASIGHSLALNKLLHGYDHTVITDFLKIHGSSITPLIGQLRWLVLLWLLFSVFINGGLLYCAAEPEQASVRTFWRAGAVHFFLFLKIAGILLLVTLLWTAALWLPVLTLLQPSLEYFSSEKYTIWMVELVLVLWLLGLAVLFAWSILSRLEHLKSGGSARRSLKRGWYIFQKNKGRYFGLVLAFAVLQALLILVYYLVQAHSGMTSPLLVVLFFFLQQLFVFCRILIRQMVYAGMGFKVKM